MDAVLLFMDAVLLFMDAVLLFMDAVLLFMDAVLLFIEAMLRSRAMRGTETAYGRCRRAGSSRGQGELGGGRVGG
eukprot:2882889-Rhodomonas_salina.2